MNIDTLRERLGSVYPVIDHVAETGSTNADLLAADDPADRTLLLADHQSAGRGRKGRSFTAPYGTQLIFSVALRPRPELIETVGLLPLAAGLAFHDTVPGSALKWPNDVLIDGKKVCGILAEADGLGEPAPLIVLGCGLNVTIAEADLPVPTATSLKLAGDSRAAAGDMTAVAVDVLTALDRRVRQWENGDEQLLTDYRAASATIGSAVRVETPSGVLEGLAEDVAADGELVLVTADNQHRTLSAGDVTHLRPWRSKK